MKLVDGSLKRPVTVTMATVAACLFGAVALSRLGVDARVAARVPLRKRRQHNQGARHHESGQSSHLKSPSGKPLI